MVAPRPALLLRAGALPLSIGADLSTAGTRCSPRFPLSLSFDQQEKDIKHNGNLDLDEVIEIARIMRDRSCAKKLTGTVSARASERGAQGARRGWGPTSRRPREGGQGGSRPTLTPPPSIHPSITSLPSSLSRSRRSWAPASRSAAPSTARTPATSSPRSTRARSTCRRSEADAAGGGGKR